MAAIVLILEFITRNNEKKLILLLSNKLADKILMKQTSY